MSTSINAAFSGDAMRQAFQKAGIRLRKPRVRRARWPRNPFVNAGTRCEAGIKNLHFAVRVS